MFSKLQKKFALFLYMKKLHNHAATLVACLHLGPIAQCKNATLQLVDGSMVAMHLGDLSMTCHINICVWNTIHKPDTSYKILMYGKDNMKAKSVTRQTKSLRCDHY